MTSIGQELRITTCLLDGKLVELQLCSLVDDPYSPTLVANLWDVTDRDIDKFAQSVFDKMGMDADKVRNWCEENTVSGTSVVSAVSQSRESCKLKYLTGAAPVLYGIPFYL